MTLGWAITGVIALVTVVYLGNTVRQAIEDIRWLRRKK